MVEQCKIEIKTFPWERNGGTSFATTTDLFIEVWLFFHTSLLSESITSEIDIAEALGYSPTVYTTSARKKVAPALKRVLERRDRRDPIEIVSVKRTSERATSMITVRVNQRDDQINEQFIVITRDEFLKIVEACKKVSARTDEVFALFAYMKSKMIPHEEIIDNVKHTGLGCWKKRKYILEDMEISNFAYERHRAILLQEGVLFMQRQKRDEPTLYAISNQEWLWGAMRKKYCGYTSRDDGEVKEKWRKHPQRDNMN